MIICKACNRECNVVTVDFGIGAYEYWGAPGVDIQLADVSNCCEADWEDTGAPEPPDDEVHEVDIQYTGLDRSFDDYYGMGQQW